MTNNSTIDGVSLLPCPFCGCQPRYVPADYVDNHGQPWPFAECNPCNVGAPVEFWNRRTGFDYSAQALQSTIARLEAQLNNAINLDFQRRERITQLESEAEFAAATYQASRDRIAELESGRGEPVANCFERRNGAGEWVNDSKVWLDGMPCSGILKECEKYPDLYRIRLAYAAPPAPVAVVLPERKIVDNKTSTRDYVMGCGWNACLDATAALNGERK